MARSTKESESYKQAPKISVAFYAKKKYTKALRWGIVSWEKLTDRCSSMSRNVTLWVFIWDNVPPHLWQNWHPKPTCLWRWRTRKQRRVIRQSTSQKKTWSRPSRLSVYAVEMNYDNVSINPAKIALIILIRLHNDRGQQSLPSTSERISYYRVCLKKTHYLMQCPYVSNLVVLLQKRKSNFKTSDGAIRSVQSRFRLYRESFRASNDVDQHVYDCGVCDRRWTNE